MRDDILKAVEVLRESLRAKEAEIAGLKSTINGLYREENEPLPYSDESTRAGAKLESLRSDQFYGQTIGAAARQYLEMRKASGQGAASISDIFYALKRGGCNFDTKNDEYAKNGIRVALRKNSTTFHKLPNGDYGLSVWYERLKTEEAHAKPQRNLKRGRRRHKADAKAHVEQAKLITKGNRTERILSILRSQPDKEWTSAEIAPLLPDIAVTSIRPLLYTLAISKEAIKTSPGRFKAAGGEKAAKL